MRGEPADPGGGQATDQALGEPSLHHRFEDLRQTLTKAEFVAGGPVGPVRR
ncbi:MAG: hypothetical protein K9N23_07570 [Akkermansiaceae bacterium]|nr:hypothetical protein [Akkermansiaceae bacterium]MCF7731529.1 hypothetical protein [Akkermansiaceae bacterium]